MFRVIPDYGDFPKSRGRKGKYILVVFQEDDGVRRCCTQELAQFGSVNPFLRSVEWDSGNLCPFEEFENLFNGG